MVMAVYRVDMKRIEIDRENDWATEGSVGPLRCLLVAVCVVNGR